MTTYIVRVVLEDAEWSDYEKLHELMEVEGFEKTITGDSGKTYYLPDAEYIWEGDVTDRHIIRDKAVSAANGTRKKHAVLVTKSDGISFRGLEAV